MIADAYTFISPISEILRFLLKKLSSLSKYTEDVSYTRLEIKDSVFSEGVISCTWYVGLLKSICESRDNCVSPCSSSTGMLNGIWNVTILT
jgi:hypothetical protein